MKKSIIFLLLLVLTCCLSLFACNVTDNHTHEFEQNWEFNESEHWHKCKECDKKSDKALHSGGTATCVKKAECEICGQEYGSFGEHVPSGEYSYDENGHWHKCKECNQDLTSTAHSGGTATCVKKAECEVCGQEYGSFGEHNFKENGVCENCNGTLALKYTAENPYEVKSMEDLIYIADLLNNDADLANCYFKQTQNIDISAISNWSPIGTIGLPFGGVYNGNNCEVTGLTIDTDASYLGLFGFVTGKVSDLTVRGTIRGINDGENNVGYAHTFAGGITGAINNGAIIENCTSYVDILGDAFIGGIVGEIMETDYLLFGTQFATVKDCVNYGKITAYALSAKNEEAMYFGGIAGRNNGYIINCVNYGEIDGDTNSENAEKKDRYVGGITGYSYIPFKNGAGPNDQMNYVAIKDSKNYGFVHGTYGVGGILGQGVFSLKNCLNEGNVQGVNCVGGIIGLAGTKATLSYAGGIISDCVNKGKIYSIERNAGGIVGYNYVTIENCINEASATITATTNGRAYYIGGIVGTNEGGKISLCKNYGEILAVATARTVNGGIVGASLGGSVLECDNYAFVKGLASVGGIVGSDAENYVSELKNCNNYGKVEGTNYVGGIIGADYKISVSGCSNSGTINGTSDVGGHIGWLSGNSLTISSCENKAESKVIASGNYAGGIVGRIGTNEKENKVVLQNCVNKGEITGVTYVGGITGGIASAPADSGSNELTIKDCKNAGVVNATQYAGGVIGVIPKYTNGQIVSCENSGEIKIEKYRAGGIVGSVEPTRNTTGGDILIDLCVNSGNVTSTTGAWLGGIVGMHGSYVYVRGCKNTGDITGVGSGNYGIGGISGSAYTNSKILSYENSDGTTTITEVSGTITGKSGCVGEVVGKNTRNAEVVATSTATVANV